MKKTMLLVFLFMACTTIQIEPGQEYQEPSFTTRLGVLVSSPDPAFLTLEMADIMESDLLEATQVDSQLAIRCLLGTQVRVLPISSWKCETRDGDGELVLKTCVGSTTGRWKVLIAHAGRCAYDMGSTGPPYEHELVHVLQQCLGRATPDWAHEDPIWERLVGERPCP